MADRYPLVMTVTVYYWTWPIEIVSFPTKHGDFHSNMSFPGGKSPLNAIQAPFSYGFPMVCLHSYVIHSQMVSVLMAFRTDTDRTEPPKSISKFCPFLPLAALAEKCHVCFGKVPRTFHLNKMHHQCPIFFRTTSDISPEQNAEISMPLIFWKKTSDMSREKWVKHNENSGVPWASPALGRRRVERAIPGWASWTAWDFDMDRQQVKQNWSIHT